MAARIRERHENMYGRKPTGTGHRAPLVDAGGGVRRVRRRVRVAGRVGEVLRAAP